IYTSSLSFAHIDLRRTPQAHFYRNICSRLENIAPIFVKQVRYNVYFSIKQPQFQTYIRFTSDFPSYIRVSIISDKYAIMVNTIEIITCSEIATTANGHLRKIKEAL